MVTLALGAPAMTFRLTGTLSFLLLAVAASERSAAAGEQTGLQPERVLFSPVREGQPKRCHIQFTPDGQYLLVKGVTDGDSVVSAADWSTRPLVTADAADRRPSLLTACFPCTAIVTDRRLLAIDLSDTKRSPVDLGEVEGHLVRWAAGRSTKTLAVMERFDEPGGINLRLSIVNPTSGERDTLHEVVNVRAIHRRQHFVAFMDAISILSG
jgi:hypothetical protein